MMNVSWCWWTCWWPDELFHVSRSSDLFSLSLSWMIQLQYQSCSDMKHSYEPSNLMCCWIFMFNLRDLFSKLSVNFSPTSTGQGRYLKIQLRILLITIESFNFRSVWLRNSSVLLSPAFIQCVYTMKPVKRNIIQRSVVYSQRTSWNLLFSVQTSQNLWTLRSVRPCVPSWSCPLKRSTDAPWMNWVVCRWWPIWSTWTRTCTACRTTPSTWHCAATQGWRWPTWPSETSLTRCRGRDAAVLMTADHLTAAEPRTHTQS